MQFLQKFSCLQCSNAQCAILCGIKEENGVDFTSLENETPRVNPSSPKSDQHQISPCNINAIYHRLAMKIKDMITQDE